MDAGQRLAEVDVDLAGIQAQLGQAIGEIIDDPTLAAAV
jgi:hypothetical protein